MSVGGVGSRFGCSGEVWWLGCGRLVGVGGVLCCWMRAMALRRFRYRSVLDQHLLVTVLLPSSRVSSSQVCCCCVSPAYTLLCPLVCFACLYVTGCSVDSLCECSVLELQAVHERDKRQYIRMVYIVTQ